MQKLKNILSRIHRFLGDHPNLHCALFALLAQLVVETLSHRSFIGGISFLFTSPLTWLSGYLIVFFTYEIAAFFKRRYFVIMLVSIPWLAIAITNFVLQGFRPNPLGAIDFLIFNTGIHIIDAYLNVAQIILIVIAILAVIGLAVLVFIKAPKLKRQTLIPSCTAVCVLLTVVLSLYLPNLKSKYNDFTDLTAAYRNYGFVYCFARSLLQSGIDKPGDYSPDSLQGIADKLGSIPDVTDENVNLIVVQLESFFDANLMKNLEYSEDPVPTFGMLKKKYSTGKLCVPSVGAGTANTEFEVLASMSLDYFGVGEYPYKTVLQNKPCESVGYIYKNMGFSTHALHNHTGTFYDRNIAYSNLGFDSFTCIEYMNDYELNSLGWEKDSILTSEIAKVMNLTAERDFVFAVSVQAHGDYPEGAESSDQIITVSGAEDEKINAKWEYYVNQLREIDDFVKDLTEYFANYDEPTVIVFYGDHMPAIDLITQDELDGCSPYQTEYVIWSNYDIAKKDKDIEAYQLMPQVFYNLGMTAGTMIKFHQTYENEENYLTMLKSVEYDILYGENIVSAGKPELEPTDMRMGTEDIIITDITQKARDILISGKNFTESSVIKINGFKYTTVFISPDLLAVPSHVLRELDEITVSQITKDKVELSTTPEYLYTEYANDITDT